MGFKKISIQLRSAATGEAIIAAGGRVIVCKPGSPDLQVISSPSTQLVIANPLTPVRGLISFLIDDQVPTVDLYIQAPGGQFRTALGVTPSGPNEIDIDTDARSHDYVIPFSIADATANVEKATGIILPANAAVQPSPLIRVTAAEASRTLSLGIVGANTGFIAAASLATAGLVKASLVVTATLGADLRVQDSANAGDLVPEQNVSRAGSQLAYLLSASTVSAKGFVTLPVRLAA